MCPPPPQLRVAGAAAPLPQRADGVFGAFDVDLPAVPLPTVAVEMVRPAGPPRDIPLAPSGKPQEPSAHEWEAAALYSLRLDVPSGFDASATEVRLAIGYAADAARVSLGGVLLTDNWLSGYTGDGALEVGLSYLAGEVPGLLTNGTALQLQLLPLKRASLEKNVFIQRALWPDFGADDVVCRVDGVTPLALQYTELVASA